METKILRKSKGWKPKYSENPRDGNCKAQNGS